MWISKAGRAQKWLKSRFTNFHDDVMYGCVDDNRDTGRVAIDSVVIR